MKRFHGEGFLNNSGILFQALWEVASFCVEFSLGCVLEEEESIEQGDRDLAEQSCLLVQSNPFHAILIAKLSIGPHHLLFSHSLPGSSSGSLRASGDDSVSLSISSVPSPVLERIQ